MTTAIVHEWLDGRLGSERVFEAFAALAPEAELFALSATPGNGIELGGRVPGTTFVDRPWLRAHRSVALPLMPVAWRRLARGTQFDTLLVSHHSFATQFARHCVADRRLAYVHAPARYVWTPELDGRGSSRLLAPVRGALQQVDRRAVDHLDHIAVNSAEVAGRIRRVWGREATVIHPPVDTTFFSPDATTPPTRDFVLGLSRFIGYKRLDLVIEAGEAAGLPVVLAGQGPEEAALRARAARATVPVTFEIAPDDERVRDLYRSAACLVFMAHEDFGIVPVEAQACGTPVVARAVGGTAETVRHGVTGVLVDDLSPGALGEAVGQAAAMSAHDCRTWAESFGLERFNRQAAAWMAG